MKNIRLHYKFRIIFYDISIENMDENLKDCSIGSITNSLCHLKTYNAKRVLHKLEDLPPEQISLFIYRIENFYSIENGTICEHHHNTYITYFSNLSNKCCDPLNRHKNKIHKDLRILELDFCDSTLKHLKLKLIPGHKICKNCETLLKNKMTIFESTEPTSFANEKMDIDSDCEIENVALRRSERNIDKEVNYVENLCSQPGSSQNSYFSSISSEFFTFSQGQRELNASLKILGMPDINNTSFFKTRRTTDANKLIHDVCKNIAQKVSVAFDTEVIIPESVTKNVIEDSLVLDKLMKNLRQEYETLNTTFKKLSILALLPIDWKREMILKQAFNCSRRLYDHLKKFREMDGKFRKISNTCAISTVSYILYFLQIFLTT